MGWAAAFIAALGGSNSCAYTMRKMPAFTLVPGIPSDYARSDQGSHGLIALSPGAPLSLSSQALSIPNFAVSQSQWRTALAGTEAGEWAVQSLPRGAACEIYLRLFGVGMAERIIVGQARDVSGVGPQSIVSGWGPLALIISRPEALVAVTTNQDAGLFPDCTVDSPHTGTLAANFNFGTHTTIQLTSSPQMERETGQDGAVLVTPTSGEPYIVTYTGVSGNNLTGVSTSAQFATTGSNAVTGDKIQEVCWVNRHPVDMARRILTSTGAGTNGTHDTLPKAWGLGIPADLIDVDGFSQTAGRLNGTISSGTYIVQTAATSPQTPPIQWLQSELARYGLWLCTRQGQISIRPALDYWRHTPNFTMKLDRSNILAVLPERSNFDPGNGAEARYFTVIGASLPDSFGIVEAPNTRPMIGTVAGGPLIQAWPNVYQNQVVINESIARRVGPWHTRICAVIDVQVNLSAAQLCVGDWVDISHAGLWDKTTIDRSLGMSTSGGILRPAMVTAISCDWTAGVVSLRLHVLPES